MEIYPLPDLTTNSVVSGYTVLHYIPSRINFLIKLRIDLIDESILFTNERLQNGVRKYSFHWRRADNEVLVRWDNAPHHRNLPFFPHHKHDFQTGSELVTDSYDILLVEVLAYIQSQLKI
jgi:hypothetical protein